MNSTGRGDANTWPEYILKRWSDLIRRPNVIGYVARTDSTAIPAWLGTPNEILLYSLKDIQKIKQFLLMKSMRFISSKYGKRLFVFWSLHLWKLMILFLPHYILLERMLPTIQSWTLTLTIELWPARFREMDRSPVVFIGHGVNKEFHYWTDIIEHIAPARFKTPEAGLMLKLPGN